MAKVMHRCLISLLVVLVMSSFAVADEVHPGLKNAIDNGDYKMAKNLVEKVGVRDIYCPASLNVDDAERIYAARDTFQIGWCFRGARGCYVEHLIDSSFFDGYMEKHCTSSAFVSKRICADWIEYGDRNKVYDSFYKWFEEGKGVCQNVETMDFCKWFVGNTKDDYRMKYFWHLENKKLLNYKTDVEFDTTVVEVIPKKECLDNIRENSAILRMSVGAKQGVSGMYNFAFGSCYFDGSKKAVKKCLNELDAFVKEGEKECKKGTLTREVKKRLKRKDFVIPLREEMRSVWYEMMKAKWYQMNDAWWNDYNLLSKYLEKYSDWDGVGSIKSSYSANGNLDITHLVRNCKNDSNIDKEVQKEFGFELFSCKEILEKYPAYIGNKCDAKDSSWSIKLPNSLNGKDSAVIVCDKQSGIYRLPDSAEQTTGMTCDNPKESWIDSSHTVVCDKKLGKFRKADELEKNAGRVCENPTESWLTHRDNGYRTEYFVCDKKTGTYREADFFEKESRKLCEDPAESWTVYYHIGDYREMLVCDKKLGAYRKATEFEREIGKLCEEPAESSILSYYDHYHHRQQTIICDKELGDYREANKFEKATGKICENPAESWMDSSNTVVCDKGLGTFREATKYERSLGLCENPSASWLGYYSEGYSNRQMPAVCDKKIGAFRDADDFEKAAGRVCETPSESWMDSSKSVVCDKKIGKFRLVTGIEYFEGLCKSKNQKKEALGYICLDGSWKKTKNIDTKDLKFEKKKIVKDKNNSEKLYFKDFRDGQIYRAVKIGWDVWMAENLNYADSDSKCEMCDFLGRQYKYESAIKACPEGWRLPTFKEWEKAYSKMGDNPLNMMAKIAPNATDKYGFSALTSRFWSSTKFGDGFVQEWRLQEDQRLSRSHPGEYIFVRCIKD